MNLGRIQYSGIGRNNETTHSYKNHQRDQIAIPETDYNVVNVRGSNMKIKWDSSIAQNRLKMRSVLKYIPVINFKMS